MILDTNALSAAADHDSSALEIVARADRLAVPVIVLGEYRLGIAQSRHRARYENWLREWISSVRIRFHRRFFKSLFVRSWRYSGIIDVGFFFS